MAWMDVFWAGRDSNGAPVTTMTEEDAKGLFLVGMLLGAVVGYMLSWAPGATRAEALEATLGPATVKDLYFGLAVTSGSGGIPFDQADRLSDAMVEFRKRKK